MTKVTDSVILGLGSNIGCRLTQLRRAVQSLKQLPTLDVMAISSVYRSQALLPNQAPLNWNQPFLNIAVKCRTSLSPSDCLDQLKTLEQALGRNMNAPSWSPRPIDIDMLAWGQQLICLPTLTIPHTQLLQRPFALNPLLDVAPDWRHPAMPQQPLTPLDPANDADKAIRTSLRINKPHTIAIINITPDSFSDGGQCEQAEQALHRCQHLIDAGAEVIDIGAESTRPGSRHITVEQEWQRLKPTLDAIFGWLDQAPLLFTPKISIDSRHVETFEKALQYPIAWLNDVDGKDRYAISQLIRGSNIRYVSMHHLGFPPHDQSIVAHDVTTHLYQFAEQRLAQLTAAGLNTEQIIFDIGIGFGKSPSQHRQLFHHLERFQSLGVPLLVGHSRKRFIHTINPTHPQQRDLETAILSALIARSGIDYLRVHQVNFTQRTLNLVDWYYQAL